jgi:hypothetical protein
MDLICSFHMEFGTLRTQKIMTFAFKTVHIALNSMDFAEPKPVWQ